jgi:hypothetical protein
LVDVARHSVLRHALQLAGQNSHLFPIFSAVYLHGTALKQRYFK